MLEALFALDYNFKDGGGRKGYSYYSAESISKYLGGDPSPRSVRRHLKTLEEKGFLVQKWNGYRSTNKYVNYDKLSALIGQTVRGKADNLSALIGQIGRDIPSKLDDQPVQIGRLNNRREITERNNRKKSPARPQAGRASLIDEEQRRVLDSVSPREKPHRVSEVANTQRTTPQRNQVQKSVSPERAEFLRLLRAAVVIKQRGLQVGGQAEAALKQATSVDLAGCA